MKLLARVKGMSIGYYIMPSDYNKTKLEIADESIQCLKNWKEENHE